MRDQKRIKRILKLIERYWNQCSDQRFGQLLINMGIVENTYEVWKKEDDDLEEYIIKNFKDKKENKK